MPRRTSAGPARTRIKDAAADDSAVPVALAVPRVTAAVPVGPAAVVRPGSGVSASVPGAASVLGSVPAAVPATAPMAAAVGQRMGSVSSAIMNLFDSVGEFLSRFSGNPITELMSGALWLVRKTIFPVGADVGRWGTAACVTTGDCSGKDLTGAILRNQYMAGVSFQSTTLEKADLRNTNLAGSDMSGADLRDAQIDAADLNGARLYTASMNGVSATNTSLVGADLVSANLTDANFSDADLMLADLGGAVLTGVTWGNATCPDGSQGGCHGPVASVDYNPGTWLPDRPDWNPQTKGRLWYLYTPTLRFTAGAPMQGGSSSSATGEDGVQGNIYNDTASPVMISSTWYDGEDKVERTSYAVLDPGTAGPYQLTERGTLNIYPNVSIVPGTGLVLGTQVTAKGQSYASAPTVRFEGGGGAGAAGRAVVENGQVVAVEITNAGFGYTTAPTVVFEGDGPGQGAAANAILGGTATSSVTKPAKLTLVDNLVFRPETYFTPVGRDTWVNKRTGWQQQTSAYEIWGSTSLFVKRERDGWTVPASDAYKELYGDPNTAGQKDWAIFTIRIKSL